MNLGYRRDESAPSAHRSWYAEAPGLSVANVAGHPLWRAVECCPYLVSLSLARLVDICAQQSAPLLGLQFATIAAEALPLAAMERIMVR